MLTSVEEVIAPAPALDERAPLGFLHLCEIEFVRIVGCRQD